MNWTDFNERRKSLGSRERIIDEACKTLRGCGKEWRLIMDVAKLLGLSDDERNNSYQSLPKK